MKINESIVENAAYAQLLALGATIGHRRLLGVDPRG